MKCDVEFLRRQSLANYTRIRHAYPMANICRVCGCERER